MTFPHLSETQFNDVISNMLSIARNVAEGTAGRNEANQIKHNLRLLEMHNITQPLFNLHHFLFKVLYSHFKPVHAVYEPFVVWMNVIPHFIHNAVYAGYESFYHSASLLGRKQTTVAYEADVG